MQHKKTIIDLGIGTSFDLTKYAGYKYFTSDNFIGIEVGANTNSFRDGPDVYGNISYTNSKTYNASTGILTVSSSARFMYHTNGSWRIDTSISIPVRMYLIM